jgi:hypothetical protein
MHATFNSVEFYGVLQFYSIKSIIIYPFLLMSILFQLSKAVAPGQQGCGFACRHWRQDVDLLADFYGK